MSGFLVVSGALAHWAERRRAAAQPMQLLDGATCEEGGSRGKHGFPRALYLTLSFFYFFVFAAIALATPIVFGRRADGVVS